jgi:hypothetical protein
VVLLVLVLLLLRKLGLVLRHIRRGYRVLLEKFNEMGFANSLLVGL